MAAPSLFDVRNVPDDAAFEHLGLAGLETKTCAVGLVRVAAVAKCHDVLLGDKVVLRATCRRANRCFDSDIF